MMIIGCVMAVVAPYIVAYWLSAKDHIPLTPHAAVEAAFMSIGGTIVAFAILAGICWLFT